MERMSKRPWYLVRSIAIGAAVGWFLTLGEDDAIWIVCAFALVGLLHGLIFDLVDQRRS
jgi:hypothetical protein